jgi:hypothetical protein
MEVRQKLADIGLSLGLKTGYPEGTDSGAMPSEASATMV